MKGYIVKFFNKEDENHNSLFLYGYWTGRKSKFENDFFPFCTLGIEADVKIYNRKTDAVKEATTLMEQSASIISGFSIEKILVKTVYRQVKPTLKG